MKYKKIITLGINAIDEDNNGIVDKDEFKRLMRFIKLWEKLYITFNESDTQTST